MRIISGKYKNLSLAVPSGNRTHPMGERVRGAIFNALGAKLADAVILDAFAGTGALGIEALSRGAAQAILVENDKRALRAIQENIARLEPLELGEVRVFPASISKFIEQALAYRPDMKFDIIFTDSPYDKPSVGLIQQLSPLLDPDGVLVLSWPKKLAPPELPGLELVQSATYADAAVHYFSVI